MTRNLARFRFTDAEIHLNVAFCASSPLEIEQRMRKEFLYVTYLVRCRLFCKHFRRRKHQSIFQYDITVTKLIESIEMRILVQITLSESARYPTT